MIATATTTTKEFRQMLHRGEGQPTREFAHQEAVKAMMSAYRATGSTREANRVYEEVLRAYGYAPDDCEGDDL